MDRLTIRIDADLLAWIKEYAQRQGTSVSKLIENQLGLLRQEQQEPLPPTPIVDSIAPYHLGADADYEAMKTDYLNEKHAN